MSSARPNTKAVSEKSDEELQQMKTDLVKAGEFGARYAKFMLPAQLLSLAIAALSIANIFRKTNTVQQKAAVAGGGITASASLFFAVNRLQNRNAHQVAKLEEVNNEIKSRASFQQM